MKLSLKIPQSIFEEIMYYVDESTGEVSGFGTLSFKDGLFQVEKVVLCEQKNRATETEMDAADIAKAMYVLKDEPNEMRWWWHSHVNMGVFWSGTDKTAMQELAQHGWFLSTVFNKKREMKTCLTFNQGQFGLFDMDDLETTIAMPKASKEVVAAWKKNLESKAKDEPVRSYGPPSRYEDDERASYRDLPLWKEKDPKREPKPISHLTFADVWEDGERINLGDEYADCDLIQDEVGGFKGVWIKNIKDPKSGHTYNQFLSEDEFVDLFMMANFPEEMMDTSSQKSWEEYATEWDLNEARKNKSKKRKKLIQETTTGGFEGDPEMDARRLNSWAELQ